MAWNVTLPTESYETARKEFVEALPTTTTGKIRRTDLRERELEGQ